MGSLSEVSVYSCVHIQKIFCPVNSTQVVAVNYFFSHTKHVRSESEKDATAFPLARGKLFRLVVSSSGDFCPDTESLGFLEYF